MKTRFLLTLTCCVFAIAGCQKPDIESDRLALLSTDKKWSDAIAGDDIDQVVSFWAEDAIVYFPGKTSVVGKKAIRQMVKKNRNTPGFSLATHPAEVIVSKGGDLGYTLGTFQLTVNNLENKSINRVGNYVCIWKKRADGSWKCAIEISNFRPYSD